MYLNHGICVVLIKMAKIGCLHARGIGDCFAQVAHFVGISKQFCMVERNARNGGQIRFAVVDQFE